VLWTPSAPDASRAVGASIKSKAGLEKLCFVGGVKPPLKKKQLGLTPKGDINHKYLQHNQQIF
jgi:hypothetical protein